MNKIKHLPPEEYQKIAAGEVVERPSNALKELIENSIDAGAQHITIYIQDSGKELIRVVDDGSGMSPADAGICFDRHATSKITSIDDLNNLLSFGFRGEALASINAVSHITLITKEQSHDHGIKIVRQGNKILEQSDISCPSGIDISIKNLFFNVPARKKFLKSSTTEWRQIVLLFQAACFSHPHIHFKLYNEERLVHQSPPVKTAQERMQQLFDQTSENNLLSISSTDQQVNLSGVVTKPIIQTYDRTNIFCFVNNRWIKNHGLIRAVLKGYTGLIPEKKYPRGVIAITIDPSMIDINIHPRKQEIEFLHPRRIENALSHAIKTALEHDTTQSITKATIPFASKTITYPAFNIAQTITPLSTHQKNVQTSVDQSLDARKPIASSSSTILPSFPSFESKQTSVIQSFQNILVGQFKKTYILIEQEQGLYLIDQHAAHERILYEQFKQRFRSIPTVELLFPQVIEFAQTDFHIIEPHLCILKDHGIIVEQFGEYTLIIRSTPIQAKAINYKELLLSLVEQISTCHEIDIEALAKKLNEHVHAQMACKTALKAGDLLTFEQMKIILDQLEKTPNKSSCPHGRPTGWLISIDTIEKTFKRKL